MNIKSFNKILAENPDSSISIMLPSGEFVASHFHITEVGKSTKQFVDCGGTKREAINGILQVWVATDTHHRLNTTKLAKIMKAASSFLTDDLSIIVEFGEETISQYPLGDVEVTPKGLLFILGNKPTACLAPDKCGVKGCC